MTDEIPTRPIRPLYDVWLRPRRVFRELAPKPIGVVDYLLGAAQGMVSWLTLCRAQAAGASSSVEEILGKALVIGPIIGVAGLYLMAAIYARLGRGAGGVSTRSQVFHVLAYGGVPIVVSLGIWLLTALLAGETAFIETPRPDTEAFVALLLHFQFIANLLLFGWSFLLQVMGFSEVQGFATRRAFGIWVLGQVLVTLAMLLLAILIVSLGAGPAPAPG
jgi:hypothetical protein